MPKKKPTPTNPETPQKVWKIIAQIFKTIGSIISKILEVLYIFFSMFFQVLKTFFFGVSSIIASTALMIIAISLTAWFVSSALGLAESETFQQERDKTIQEVFEQWQESRKTHRQYQAAAEESVRIEKITDLSCQTDSQCTTPQEYLTRSSCPFESRCLENECVIVCPQP